MGVDVARGLAVFGMIGVHVGVAATFDAMNPLTWTALVEGRSSILFAVVAGISVAFATGIGTRPQGEALRSARLRMAGRALAVLAIGLALELLGSSIAVILPIYGLLFLILIPFLGLRRRTLLLTATGLALAGPTLIALLRTLALGGSGAGVDFLITGSYPLTVWLPLILAGMAVGRTSLQETKNAAILTGIGVLLAVSGYGVGNVVNGSADSWTSEAAMSKASSSSAELTPGNQTDREDMSCTSRTKGLISCFSDAGGGAGSMSGSLGDQDVGGTYLDRLGTSDIGTTFASAWGVSPHSGGTFEILGSGGFALAVVGVCVLMARPLRWVLLPLAAVGSMPLTAYSLHVISFAILISPVALAPELVGFDSTPSSIAFWLACLGTLLAGCTAWTLFRGRGPLERITARASRAIDHPAALNATSGRGVRRARGEVGRNRQR
ncbi:heparan-alpha-glucosaminide N-acetyltransferase domain-containing protein [Microbacterium sp. 22303]|uniref:heparan-alpha-glucosaminide N-acetyltransferase domain-containing protein n=1 Tax=Microbacterium sp. 22303 TaxID=3453905 RepID=UPI003F84199D